MLQNFTDHKNSIIRAANECSDTPIKRSAVAKFIFPRDELYTVLKYIYGA